MRKGFTLIELLIVIAIIGLLSTLAIISLGTAQQKARDTKRIADVGALQSATEIYNSENGNYPVSADWATLSADLGSYMTIVPIDPDNGVDSYYIYAVNGNVAADASEYVIGAQLEDTAHDALNGDDDTVYTATAGWADFAATEVFINSTDANVSASTWGNATTAVAAVVQADCDDAASEGIFCLSD